MSVDCDFQVDFQVQRIERVWSRISTSQHFFANTFNFWVNGVVSSSWRRALSDGGFCYRFDTRALQCITPLVLNPLGNHLLNQNDMFIVDFSPFRF